MEGLASLVDKSLLRQEERTEGEALFWMLQTLREFGLERLSDAGEMETTWEAHAQYYLTLTEKEEVLRFCAAMRSFFLGEYEAVRLLLEQTLEYYRILNDTERMGWVLYLLAPILFMAHADIERAYNRAEQSLTYLREVGYHQGKGYVLSLSGLISLLGVNGRRPVNWPKRA